MILVNVKHVSHIKVYPKKKAWQYKYYPTQKNWFGRVIKENIQCELLDNTKYKTEDFLKKNKDYILVDDVLYLKPHIEITLSNKDWEIKYFKTVKEMHDYVDKLKKEIRLWKI